MDDLSNQTQFRLEMINKIEDYFIAEIREIEQMSTKISKYNVAFDYFDKILINFSATSSGLTIIFITAIGAPVRMFSESFVFHFL